MARVTRPQVVFVGAVVAVAVALAVAIVWLTSGSGPSDSVDDTTSVQSAPSTTATTVARVPSSTSEPPAPSTSSTTTEPEPEGPTGLAAFVEFPIGVAVPSGIGLGGDILDRPELQEVVRREFSEITTENILKPLFVQPAPGVFSFDESDRLVDFAEEHRLRVHGHTLLFQAFDAPQVPQWMFDFSGSREDWRRMIVEHVETVVGRYAGRIESWDVVNEALSDRDGSIRPTVWQQGFGDGYIEEAFRAARRADPGAELYYNDYKLPDLPHKLEALIDMVDDFRDRGVPIDGIGFQMHVLADFPELDTIRDALARAAETGLKIKITELDVRVGVGADYTELAPDVAQRQAEQYAGIVRAYVDAVPPAQRGGITVWGVSDPDSYLSGGPDWPLLFDGELEPKPAYFSVLAALQED